MLNFIENLLIKYYNIISSFFIKKINLYVEYSFVKLLFILIDVISIDFDIFYNNLLDYIENIKVFSFKKIIKILIHIFLFFSGITVVIGLLIFFFFFFKYFIKYLFIILDFYILKYNNLYYHIRFYICFKYICTQFFIIIPKCLKTIKKIFFYIVKFMWFRNFIKNYILLPLDNFLYKKLCKFEEFVDDFDINDYDFKIQIRKPKKLRKFILFLRKIKITIKNFFRIIYYNSEFIIMKKYILIKNFFKFFFRVYFWLYLEIYLILIKQSIITSFYLLKYYILHKLHYNIICLQIFLHYYIYYFYLFFSFYSMIIIKFSYTKFKIFGYFIFILLEFLFYWIIDVLIKKLFYFIIIMYYKTIFFFFDRYFIFYIYFVALVNYYSFWLEVHSILYYPLRRHIIRLKFKNIKLLYFILKVDKDLVIFYKILIKMFFYCVYVHFFTHNYWTEKEINDFIDEINRFQI